jgi:hypothetical protein
MFSTPELQTRQQRGDYRLASCDLAQDAHISFGFSAIHFLSVTTSLNCLLGSFQVIPHPKCFSDGWTTWMAIATYIEFLALIFQIDIDK